MATAICAATAHLIETPAVEKVREMPQFIKPLLEHTKAQNEAGNQFEDHAVCVLEADGNLQVQQQGVVGIKKYISVVYSPSDVLRSKKLRVPQPTDWQRKYETVEPVNMSR
jgi:hypothetical protein